MAGALELAELNRRSNGWLIFYTHDVRPSPSKFGCTPELLEALVKSVVEDGCRIMKVADVVSKEGLVE